MTEEESPAPDAATVSREKVELRIPPRAAVLRPGEGSAFGRGFFRRLIGIGPSVLVYLALLAIGIGVFLLGLAGTTGPYEEGLRGNHGPLVYPITLACGAVFSLLVLRSLQVALNRERQRPERPRQKLAKKEPWAWDYPWSRDWMPPDGKDMDSTPLGKVTFIAFVALCNVLWLTGETFWTIFLTGLDLLALFLLYRWLRKGVQSVRFRTPVVIWEEIPVHPGGQLQGRIAFPRDVRPTGPSRLTLRCVEEERSKISSSGAETRYDQDVFAVYREIREVPLPGAPGEPLDVLSFSFQIPRGLSGNNLLSKYPVYWQLAVDVPVAGPDLEVAFLAPVYQKLARSEV